MTRTRSRWGLALALVIGAFALFLATGAARVDAQATEPEFDPGQHESWHDSCVAGGFDAVADAMETHDEFGVHEAMGHMGATHGWPDGFAPMHGETPYGETPYGPSSDGGMW